MTIFRVKDFIIQKYSWIQKQQNYFAKYTGEKETTDFNNGEIIYLLGRKYIINLVKDKENKVTIGEEIVEIHIKEKYIEDKEYKKRIYEKWIKEFSMPILYKLTEKYQEMLKGQRIKFPKIEIRKMKRRWGCCFPKQGKIVYNLGLIKVPMECIEYVVLHELSHFKHPNHSTKFYNFVANYMPDWKSRKKILDKEYTVIIT